MSVYGVMYIILTVLTFGISEVIKPCIRAVLEGFNFIDDEMLLKVRQYFYKLIVSMNQLKKIEKQSPKWATGRSSDESISVSRASKAPAVENKVAGQAIKKGRRVAAESGNKNRSFKLSVVFLVLQLLGILLAFAIVAKDYIVSNYSYGLISDIETLYKLSMMFQFENYAFLYKLGGLSYAEFEKSPVLPYIGDELKTYVANSFSLAYDNPDFQGLKNSIFFGDMCQKISDKLSAEAFADCKALRGRTFLNGLTPTIELSKAYAKNWIFNQAITDNTGMTEDLVLEYRNLSKYLQVAVAKMLENLSSLTQTMKSFNLVLSCLLFGGFIAVCFVILFSMERLIGRSIDSEYVFIRQVYEHFIPDEVITKENLLRIQYKRAGILNN